MVELILRLIHFHTESEQVQDQRQEKSNMGPELALEQGCTILQEKELAVVQVEILDVVQETSKQVVDWLDILQKLQAKKQVVDWLDMLHKLQLVH